MNRELFRLALKLTIFLSFISIIFTLNTQLVEAAASAPDVTITFPKNHTNSSTTTYVNFTYNVTDVDARDNITNCTLFLLKSGDWETNITNQSAITFLINQSINITKMEEGSYLWKVGCYDNNTLQGNSSYYNLTIDTTAPTVTINKGPGNYHNFSLDSVNFTYQVSDTTSETENCSLWLYQSGSWSLNSSDIGIKESINQSLNVTLEDSSINWTVACYDHALNQGNSTPYNLTIDTTAPRVTGLAPINYTNTTSSFINFTFNVSDDGTNIANCSLWLYNQGVWNLNQTDTSISEKNQSWRVTKFGLGEYNWTVACYDYLNQQGNSSHYLFTIIKYVLPEGGVSHGEPNTVSKDAILTQDLTSFIEFYNPNLPLISIDLKLKEEASLQVSANRILESFIDQKLENVYSYFVIETNLDNTYFEYVKMNFKVKKDYEDVMLYQLSDGDTYKIASTKIYTDSKYDYFQANIEGGGYFVITAKLKEVIENPVVGNTAKSLKGIKIKKETVLGLLVLILCTLTFFYIKPHWKKL